MGGSIGRGLTVTAGGGYKLRGKLGVPIAPPGVPEYPGIGRAYGSDGTPPGEGTYLPSLSYSA